MTDIAEPDFYTGFAPPAAADAARLLRQVGDDLGGRYDVTGYLGRGAYATVWRALDRVTGEPLAVKCFDGRVQKPRGFYREMSTLFRLKHPRIVRIVNLLESAGGARYLLLEFCPGGTLRLALSKARRAGRPFPPARAGAIGRQLVQGLVAAHREGLVHRDIKPENVLFDASADLPFGGSAGIKLADFGLARVFAPAGSSPDGMLPSISGSPAYMAPEQFTGDCRPASDLYALGVILFELLHGRTPFEGPPEGLARQHLYERPPIDPALPGPWHGLLAGLLAKNPADRPSGAELERLLGADAAAADADDGSSTPVSAFCDEFGAAGIPATQLYPGPASGWQVTAERIGREAL